MMLRQLFITAFLFLVLVNSASSSLADTKMTEKEIRKTIESYCMIEFKGAWVEDRWALIKFSAKRKAENKYRAITDSAVFGLKHYPFIVVSSYEIIGVRLLDSVHGTANVVYRQLAHSVDESDGHWHLVAEPPHDETVTLNLVFDKNQWWVLDPPPSRISKGVLIEYYEYQVKKYSSIWEQKLNDPTYNDRQKANVRANRDQATGALQILKSLP